MSVYRQLCSGLRQNLDQRGWKTLRPIQELAFADIAAGRNVLVFAPTAGGKTEAAMLPLLNRHSSGERKAGVKILYVAPLIALLNNIETRFAETKLCESVYFTVFKWHGDVTRGKKLKAAKDSPDVLLTTPESLDVILCNQYLKAVEFFAPLDAVVIDETHYFAGGERGGQLVSALNRLEQVLNRDLQRVCLSATVGNPDEVLEWMTIPSKREKVVVRVAAQSPERVVELNFFDSEDPHAMEALTSTVVRASVGKKSIIFEPSRKAAETRSKDFPGKFAICHVHHSSIAKELRENAELELSEARKAATVIATCTLELGLDVGDLDLIQQEGELPSVSSFIQRIGRTGRRQPPQRCLVHVTDEFDFLKNLAIITLADTGFVENNALPTNYYYLMLQQLLLLALGRRGIPIEEARAEIRNCGAMRGISDADFDELMTFWLANDALRLSDGRLLIGGKVEQAYAPTNYKDLALLKSSVAVLVCLTAKGVSQDLEGGFGQQLAWFA